MEVGDHLFRQEAGRMVAALTRLSDQLRTVPGLQSLRRKLLVERRIVARKNDRDLLHHARVRWLAAGDAAAS